MPRVRMERLLACVAVVVVVIGLVGCAARRTASPSFDEPPRLLWSPAPAYPESLLQARVDGFVMVEALVDTSGAVDCGSVRVLRSTRPEFERPAVETVCDAQFRPARLRGRPTVAVVDVPIRFEVRGERTDAQAATEATAEVERLAAMGEIRRAIEQFVRAERLDARVASRAGALFPLCWYGSLWGYAAEVVDTCDRLVALDPGDSGARDARGIARALTGDFEGAIADFAAVRAASTSDARRAEREAWIRDLRAGRNPLTPELLERLRGGGGS